jgi:hypothetical protein
VQELPNCDQTSAEYAEVMGTSLLQMMRYIIKKEHIYE